MKVFITDDLNLGIDGFNTIPVVQGGVMLGNIPRNGCEFILVKNCLDKIKDDVLEELAGKMRKEGELSISGMDINSINRKFYTKEIDKKEFMEYILDKYNLYSIDEITERLQKSGLTIVSALLKGSTYDIRAVRHSK